VHPHEKRHVSDDARERVRALLAAPEVVAVGEDGARLSLPAFGRPTCSAARSRPHLQLGQELGKPVIVHARDADDDMAAILRSCAPPSRSSSCTAFRPVDAVWEPACD